MFKVGASLGRGGGGYSGGDAFYPPGAGTCGLRTRPKGQASGRMEGWDGVGVSGSWEGRWGACSWRSSWVPVPWSPRGRGGKKVPLPRDGGPWARRLDWAFLPSLADLSLCPPLPAVVTADHVCMRQGLRSPCRAPLPRLPSHAFPPCRTGPHQLQVPSLEQEAALSSCSITSQLPRSLCSAQSRVAFPAFASHGLRWTPPAPPVAKRGRPLSLVPASG